ESRPRRKRGARRRRRDLLLSPRGRLRRSITSRKWLCFWPRTQRRGRLLEINRFGGPLMRRTSIKIALLAAGAVSSTYHVMAQPLAPGAPDVVFECFSNGQPSNSCEFSCGPQSTIDGQHEKRWGWVFRAELYHYRNGFPHSWVLVKSGNPQVVTEALLIGPGQYCRTEVDGTINSGHREMRITKFKIN